MAASASELVRRPAARVGLLVQLLADPNVRKVVYNAQLALLPLLALAPGLTCASLSDPMLAAYLCDSNSSEADLELTALLLKAGLQSAAPGGKPEPQRQCECELRGLLALDGRLADKLAAAGLQPLYSGIEVPLAALLARVELRGLHLDMVCVERIRAEVSAALGACEAESAALLGRRVNLSSPDQVAELLYEELRLPAPAVRPGRRHASTAEEDLLRVRALHPAVDLVLAHRALSKALATYVCGLEQFALVDPRSGAHKIHPTLRQVRTDLTPFWATALCSTVCSA